MTGQISHGVECTSCHTVYFIEHASNRERLYYASPGSSEMKRLGPRTPFYEISDFVQHWKLSFILPNLWKLLCICGKQVHFVKTQLKWYEVSQEALERRHAIQGEWKEVSEVIARMHNDVMDTLWSA